MRSYLRPSIHRRTSANTRFAGFRRVGRPHLSHRLRLGKSRMLPMLLALAPPPAWLPIAPPSPPLLCLHIRFLRHRPGHLLPIAPNVETSRTASCTKPPHPAPSHTMPPPPLSSKNRPASLPQPLRLLCPPCFSCPAWVGLPPPNPPPHTTEPTTEPTCSLAPLSLSPTSNARLVATTKTPTTALLSRPLFLLCRTWEMFLQDASMQSSRDGSYGPALRGEKYET